MLRQHGIAMIYSYLRKYTKPDQSISEYHLHNLKATHEGNRPNVSILFAFTSGAAARASRS